MISIVFAARQVGDYAFRVFIGEQPHRGFVPFADFLRIHLQRRIQQRTPETGSFVGFALRTLNAVRRFAAFKSRLENSSSMLRSRMAVSSAASSPATTMGAVSS